MPDPHSLPPSDNPLLPILGSIPDTPSGSGVDLKPTFLLQEGQPLLWTLSDGRKTVAVFSNIEKARRYRETCFPHSDHSIQIETPDMIRSARALAACYASGIRIVALNPEIDRAESLFDLQQALRSLRDHLQSP